MKVFIDSNVFINFLTNSEDSERAYRLMFDLYRQYDLYTSITVVEEIFYILTREGLRVRGIDNKFKLKEYISETGYDEIKSYSEKFLELLDEILCTILGVNTDATSLLEIMLSCKLLPNDALIAATCKHYGIKKIATFDSDFKRVGFLEVVEV